MLLNRTLAWLRGQTPSMRVLAMKARDLGPDRPAVVLIPGMLGTRLVDALGKPLWGTTGRLYRGPSVGSAREVQTDGLLRRFALVPGLVGYDVYGALMDALRTPGGWREGENLWALDYDWRVGIEEGARALERFVEGLDQARHPELDLISASTGALIVRRYLDRCSGERIRRVIDLASPHRGTFDALRTLHHGTCFAPGGRRLPPSETCRFQTAFDALPHPDIPLFIDEHGCSLPFDLYDPDTWRTLRIGHHGYEGLDKALEEARLLHRRLDRAPPFPRALVVGARCVPTPHRALVVDQRLHVPKEGEELEQAPWRGKIHTQGDGDLSMESLVGLLGLGSEQIRWVEVSAHHRIMASPEVHRLVLEALLAP